jgi:1-deoxy-D-xylulose-5-phosphate synthase
MVPANENECCQMLTTGFLYEGPSAVRYPRTPGIGEKLDLTLTPLPLGKAKLCRSGHKIALLVFGTLLANALQAAEQLDATVVNMRFVKPLDEDLILSVAQHHDLLVTLEENVLLGGAGSAVNECLHAHACIISVLNLGLPDIFVEQGDRTTLLAHYGLDTAGILRAIARHLSALKPVTYLTGITPVAKII